MIGASPSEKAYLAPFLAFFFTLALGATVEHFGDGRAFWVFSEPRYWVCPLQTVLCGALLLRYWRTYRLEAPAKPLLTAVLGILALAIWIAPQEWLGRPRRWEGFDPAFF